MISQSVMCEKWVAIFKVKVTVTEFGFIQWNHDYFYYMFWTAEFLATNLVWQCMFISWSVLWKGCFAVFKVKVTVKVLNFSECLPRQYLWSIKLSMVMYHHQPEYHSEISFCYVEGQSHNHFYYIFRNTETVLQSNLAWWYIITRQGRHCKKIFFLSHRAWDRIWLVWLWTRLLPLLAILISKAGVNTSSNQENVERTWLL